MAAESYSFDTTYVDVARMSVTRGGQAVPLEPKALDVLLYLLEHRDRLVTKDELLDAVWKDTFVTPNALTRVVAQLRKGLGDDAHEARIIETVSKRGYRFIAPVTATAVTPERQPLPDPAPDLPPAVMTAPPRAEPRRGYSAIIALALVLVVAVAAAGWLMNRPKADPAAGADIAATRFTTRQGYDGLPAVSPDGRSVVYVSDRTGSLELYSTGLAIGSPEVALTNNGGRNVYPEWSPDGQWIAFRSQRLGGIWVVPSAGGTPQQIVEFGTDPSWAADSDRLVFVSDGISTATPSVLWTVRRNGSDRKPITMAAPMVGSISNPIWSNNGRFIAYSVNPGSAFRDIWVVTPDGQSARKLATGLTGKDIRWTPGDDALLWGGTTETGLSRLIRLAVNPETGEAAGAPEGILPIDGGSLDGLSITRDGRALFGIARTDSNLWQIEIKDGVAGEPVRLTNDGVRTTYPRIGPDGRIAFIQFVEGREVAAWLMSPDGATRSLLLTSGRMQGPQWSRDGRRMFVLLDNAPVWVDLETRRTTPISVKFDLPSGVQLAPDDAGLLNHRGGPGGIMNVWLSPFDGGPPRQMTFDREGASYGAFSPDGRWIGMQLTRGADTWLAVMPAQPGAAVVPLVRERGQSWLYTWSADSSRMAFAGERDAVWNIYDVERATGVVRQLTHWKDREGYVRYPAWAPKGDRIVFERSIRTSSLWSAKIW
jgi:Tol biopolymer transport system component/DNA-binding winged helix-turn-helix (wHTH) protein